MLLIFKLFTENAKKIVTAQLCRFGQSFNLELNKAKQLEARSNSASSNVGVRSCPQFYRNYSI